jgi:hypothetical protein
MVQVSAKSWTLEAFLQLPETKPASENLDGQIIQPWSCIGRYAWWVELEAD